MDAAFQTSSDAPTAPVSTASDHRSIGQWARETRLGNAIAGLAISSALFAGCAGETGSRDGAIKSQTPSSEVGDTADSPTTTAVLNTPTTDTPTTDAPTTQDAQQELRAQLESAAKTYYETFLAYHANPSLAASEGMSRFSGLLTPPYESTLANNWAGMARLGHYARGRDSGPLAVYTAFVVEIHEDMATVKFCTVENYDIVDAAGVVQATGDGGEIALSLQRYPQSRPEWRIAGGSGADNPRCD